MEGYLKWAVLALLGYTFVAPLMKVATGDMPSTVAALIANGVLILGSLLVVLAVDIPVVPYLTEPSALYAYAAGVCLTVGILAYYQALSTGPVAIVVPIFGMFIVTSSVVSALWLEEPLTLRKVAGIGFAAVAVYLTAGPGQ